MELLLAIVFNIAFLVQSFILLRLLKKERKVSAERLILLEKSFTQNHNTGDYHRRVTSELRDELRESRKFTREIEAFGNERVRDLDRCLQEANGLIEILVEGLDTDQKIKIDRNKARRLFVS